MLSISLILALTASSLGADPSEGSPKAIAEAASPYLDEQVYGLIHVSPRQIDSEALARIVGALLDQSDPRLREWQASVSRWREASTKAGLRDFFLLLSFADPGSPAVIVLKFDREEINPQTAVDLARPLWGAAETADGTTWYWPPSEPSPNDDPGFVGRSFTRLAVEVNGSNVFIGNQTAVRHLKAVAPKPRPELFRALEAIGESEVQLVTMTSHDQRRIAEEFYPILPANMGGGSAKVITRGALWASAGLSFKNGFAMTVRAQSQNPSAAKSFADRLPTLLKFVGSQLLSQGVDPFGGKSKLEVVGDQLHLDLKPGELANSLLRNVIQFQQNSDLHRRARRLRSMAIAMHNYNSTNDCLPGRAAYPTPSTANVPNAHAGTRPTKNSKPTLSWRVALLPFLEEQKLFTEFRFDEPWDSEHNKKLIPRMPAIYRSGIAKLDAEFKTCIQVPVGPRTLFTPDGPGIKYDQITDGLSVTIMLFEASEENAVVWTKPDDWEMAMSEEAMNKLFGRGGKAILASFADGAIRLVPRADRKMLELLLMRDDGQPVVLPPLIPY
jgi:hypothetical protein